MVDKIISEGAEARISLTEFMGMQVVLKARLPKRYRVREIDEALRASRTKSEARIMSRLLHSGASVPRMLRAGRYTILMEFLPGEKLSESISHGAATPSTFRNAGRILAAIHNSGVSHGDFTPANILRSKGKLFAIDFGLSTANAEDADKAIDLLLMKRSIDPDSFSHFIEGYDADGRSQTILKLSEIECMGRYQSRTLDAN